MATKRPRRPYGALGAGVVLAWAGTLLSGGEVREITGKWAPPDLRRVSVAGAAASSTLGSQDGQYAPVRAVDGNRGTKWVASVAPSQAAPQWITLELFGVQRVSAVAVFGERVDNDGIQDAQVEVAGDKAGEFATVATIEDAKSAASLATFDPVETTAIRLSVSRSGGPSSHTDVYEIEVFGPELSAGELKGYAAERMKRCGLRSKELAATAERLGLKTDAQFAGLRGPVDAAETQWQQLSRQFALWDTLDEASQRRLVAEMERFDAKLQKWLEGIERAALVWPDRARELTSAGQAAEQALQQAGAGENVVYSREGDRVRVGNNRVSVVLDETEGAWEATWLGGVDAAVRGVRCAVEADGQTLAPQAVKSETVPLDDAIGAGLEIGQRWGEKIEVQRRIRVYHGRPAVVVSIEIANRTDRDVKLGTARVLDLSQSNRGWWHLGNLIQAPAAVGYPGASPACRPAPDEEVGAGAAQQYASAGVLALAPSGSAGALVIGSLSAREGSPSIHARFQSGEGGTSLGATLSMRGRVLPAGQTVVLDPAWLSVEEDRHAALERYGDAVAALAPKPLRTGANALWCSWYPIRMGINEEIVLAHAAIAAEHFKPLGFDVIQLDHGWQRGDVCGDWTANERFPHGLRWLAEQLQSRHGMKLGLWIAPTQVAFTSQLFRDHPEWMIRDAEGKPASTGRWFWVPNPQMTVIDASHPAAEQWIEETFARLSSEGAAYYKIDFIAGSPALARAMAAIRRGAGPDAWIRYCQTPPLLSAGLASSAYIGPDTGDAGLSTWMDLERANAPLLAASYWVNDRLYHREVCDMSVGMKADVEEARFRLSLMTLSGCSISFSDDFRPLEPSRIRMMQQCLPPGNPTARPLDLFERTLPSLWHMHCRNEAGQWDAVGAFNFEDEPQQRTVEFSALGLPADAEVAVFEFWEEKFLGTHKERLTLTLAPRTARILLIHRRPVRPDVIATNMHVLGGYHELERLAWDEKVATLSGRARRMPGVSGRVYLYVPQGYRPAGTELTHVDGPLWTKEIVFEEAEVDFRFPFDHPGK